jgi:hypothetical protein
MLGKIASDDPEAITKSGPMDIVRQEQQTGILDSPSCQYIRFRVSPKCPSCEGSYFHSLHLRASRIEPNADNISAKQEADLAVRPDEMPEGLSKPTFSRDDLRHFILQRSPI